MIYFNKGFVYINNVDFNIIYYHFNIIYYNNLKLCKTNNVLFLTETDCRLFRTTGFRYRCDLWFVDIYKNKQISPLFQ